MKQDDIPSLVEELLELLAKGWYEPGDYSLLAVKADTWIKRVREIGPIVLDALSRPKDAVGDGVPATEADMAAFGASDAACYLYPGENEAKERAAFCAGAAHASSYDGAAARERIARIIDPYIDDDGSHVSHMARQFALEKADAILAALPTSDAAVDWRHKLWMVACHATGGGIPEIEGVDRSINDICVQISAHKNAIWKQAQEVALRDALPTSDASERLREDNYALREALIACGRHAGVFLADGVSTDFLMNVPEEVRLKIAALSNNEVSDAQKPA